MERIKINLDNLDKSLPDDFSDEQRARVQTLFLKKLSFETSLFSKISASSKYFVIAPPLF